MKILFWSNSSISVPFLERLINNPLVKTLAVVTTPDKPQGRGLKILPSAVKSVAVKYNLPVIETENINEEKFYNTIKEFLPELSIVVSYGKIIPKQIISLHRIGMVNIHFSLLPKYRGAAPVQWVLINGEKETGITAFWMDEGMDTGNIFIQKQIAVDENDNYYTLLDKIIQLGLPLLDELITKISENKIVSIPQQGNPTYAPMIKKSQAKIDWAQPASKVHNLVRALVHWPKAYTTIKSINREPFQLKIIETEVYKQQTVINNFQEGSIVKIENGCLIVKCGNNTYIKILKLQPENRKVLTSQQFVCGYRIVVGDRFV